MRRIINLPRELRRHLTSAHLIACVALFVALGGSAVAVSQIPRNSVGPAQLKRGAVKTQHLSRAAVKRNKIAPRAINNTRIAVGAVNAPKIANGSINRNKIRPGAVDASRLAADSVGPEALQAGAVGADALASGAVGSGHLANNSVTRAKVAEASLPMLATLRSGQTLRGMFALGGPEGTYLDAQTFEFPMVHAPAAPTANVVDIAGGSPAYTEECPGIAGGNQQTPNAAPGQLCFYITTKSGDFEELAVASESLTRLGFGLSATFGAGGGRVIGQWAATAR